MSATTSEQAAPFARVSVMGSRRNVDVVLPTHEPLYVLLPSLLDLLDEPARLGEFVLSTVGGTALDMDQPLAVGDLRDGSLLRLTRRQETPSDPVVFDVVETTQWISTRVRGVWDHSTSPSGLAALAGGLWLALVVLWSRSSTPPTTSSLSIMAGLAATAAVLAATAHLRAASWLYWALATGVALWAIRTSVPPGRAALWATCVAVAALILAGICSSRRQAFLGAAVGLAAVTGGWYLLSTRLTSPLQAAAVVGVVLVITAGFLPRVALQISGVFRMDASVTDGGVVRRRRARMVIEEAHWSLAACVCVLSALMALVGWRLAPTLQGGGWQLALLVDLLVAWTLRSRHLPLLVERAAMGLASVALAAVTSGALLRAHPSWLYPLLVSLGATATALSIWNRLPLSTYSQALARRWADRLETLTIVALVPLLVGVFDAYTDLMRTFS